MSGIEVLVGAIRKETDDIKQLLKIVVQQRNAVRDGNFEAMQDLMKLLHSASLEVQKSEALRDKAAGALAASLSCEKTLQALCEKMENEELKTAGDALTKVANAVGAESKILKRLIDEGQKFNDMMLSELRRFSSAGMMNMSGSMDLKG